ncbi:MAG: DUF2191 domain-containing protein [Deltaproteobacteria bacterium]|nr:DUF2191 domain-containing protein [Deltaproteobacteria bacterium]
MRTSIDIPDALFAKIKRLARKRGLPFRELVEEGLQHVLAEDRGTTKFKLEDRSFEGDGLVVGLAEGDWERIRDLTYEGRGA